MQAISIEASLKLDFDYLVNKAEDLCNKRSKDALAYIEEANSHAKQSGDIIEIVTAKYLEAYYNPFVMNDYDGGINIINDLLQNLEEDDINEIGYKLYMTLGNASQLKGDVFESQKAYLAGVRILENKKSLAENEKKSQAGYYYNLALLLTASQFQLDTEDYLNKAISINEELGLSFKLSKCYLAYGSFLEKANKNLEAKKMFEKALALDVIHKDLYSIALSTANLGYINNKMGESAAALENFIEALHYFENNQRLYESGMTKLGMGECYFKKGEREKGLAYIMEAETIFTAIDNKQDLSDCYQKLSSLLKEDGQFEKSIYYLEKYNEMLKYFFDIDKTNALARAKKEFESEQKEKESLLLKQKNEEIQQYVHKLEGSNNSLKQFAHVASHDLREPLRMINSYMNLLERSMGGAISEQQRDFLDFAIGGAKRMDNLIIDMLQLAKVDANPRIENIKLENIVEEIRLNLDVMLKEKNALIVSGNLPEIKADRTQMLQLFQNLIANGLKYNESKTPIVKLKATMNAAGFEITVSDNGIGIPAQSRDKVFEIFTRLPTANKYTGTGIGLSICRKIVDSMNGKIGIEDNPQGGTTFRIALRNDILSYHINPKNS